MFQKPKGPSGVRVPFLKTEIAYLVGIKVLLSWISYAPPIYLPESISYSRTQDLDPSPYPAPISRTSTPSPCLIL